VNRYIVIRFTILNSRFTIHVTKCSTIPSSSSSWSRRHCCAGFRNDLSRCGRIRRDPRFPTNQFLAVEKPKPRRNASAVFSMRSGNRRVLRHRRKSRPSEKQTHTCFPRCLPSLLHRRHCLLRQLPQRRCLRFRSYDGSSRPRPSKKQASKCAISPRQHLAIWPRSAAAPPRSNKASRSNSGHRRVSAMRLSSAKFSDHPAVCSRSIRSAVFDSRIPAKEGRFEIAHLNKRRF
jgi:hypothetical protein